MKHLRKIILILMCTVLFMGSTIVGCKNDKPVSPHEPVDPTKAEYSIYVRSMGGLGLEGVSVSVSSSGENIASGKTDGSGKFAFKADKGSYDVSVTELPDGYTLIDANNYKTSATKTSLLILAASSVMAGPAPETKVYKQGDVIYDFTITDKTESSTGVAYTLSEVLKTKKMVLLNFWNTQCGPCMSEMPAMELAYVEYKETVEVFGISVPLYATDKLSEVRKVKSDSSLTFPIEIDSNNMAYHFNTATGIPKSVVIDRYGVVALIHTGRLDKAGFTAIFQKYTSDDYVQDTMPDDDPEDPSVDLPEREKPNVSQPASEEIEAAINGTDFTGKYYPESQTSDAEYSWPWVVDETDGVQYIRPANEGVDYSFATIYTKVTLSDSDVEAPGGKVVLAFDLQWSCENRGDYFYVIVNNALVYEYTGTEQWGEWQPCYALVADEPGEYTLCLMYVKDQQLSDGFDTVRIKNMRLISTDEINIPSLDMPRDAARGWDGTNFSSYIDVAVDADGFYHKDTPDGSYIVADLMNMTLFNNRLDTSWSLSEFAVNNYFDYNTVEYDDPDYDESLDDTEAVSIWLMAANNSELPGLTLINDELIALLNKFFKTQVSNWHDKMWLELCKYFDHYGTDKNDKGISTPDRNPIRGLLNSTAVPMVKVHKGAFTDLKDIPDEYKNKVVLPRLIVPRGFKYVFEPEESGVYRVRSQSKALSDTMAWLMDYDAVDEDYLVSTDYQLENADEEYNYVLTYYLEKGKKYILATCLADIGGTGEFTFTTEYLDKEYYSWQFAARNYFTTTDEDMGEIINYKNVEPVLNEADQTYYNAKKDANGNYVMEGGKYVANLEDPIYVDFLTGARFFDEGSLELAFDRIEKDTIVKTLSSALALLWKKTKPDNGWAADKTISSIKGSTLTENDWAEILYKLYQTYGDVYIVDKDEKDEFVAVNPEALKYIMFNCNTLGQLADYLKLNYLNLFDMRGFISIEGYEVPESRRKDYTALVRGYYEKAKAYKGDPEREYADRGCVKLTEELRDALDMFAKRVGGFPEIDTDWLRLCAHFEYIGPRA